MAMLPAAAPAPDRTAVKTTQWAVLNSLVNMAGTLIEIDAATNPMPERRRKQLLFKKHKATGHPFSPAERRGLRGLVFYRFVAGIRQNLGQALPVDLNNDKILTVSYGL